MKQNITAEQLKELNEKEKKKLRDWWNPKEGDMFLDSDGEVFYGQSNGFEDETYLPDKIYFKCTDGEGKETDLPLLSIGQMIEFLGINRRVNKMVLFKNWEAGDFGGEDVGYRLGDPIERKELCDALWELVKSVLKK